MKQIKSAKGMRGYLLPWNGNVIFRDAATGVDYSLLHPDMTITIEDDDTFIKENESGELFLDVSDKTLGKDDSNT